jgi:acyl-CoA thioesterase-1
LRNLAAAVVIGAAGAATEPVTIAALGDSLTQGYGLPEADGLVPQLQGWLDAQGAGVRLVNAGVSGDTTAGGLSRIGWTLTPEVDALIVALGGNDLLRGIDPAVSRRNLEGILQAAREAGVPVLLAGLPAPPNYGPDYKAAFDAIWPELAAEYDAILVGNLLGPLADAVRDGTGPGTLLQPDGLHPSAEGVRLVVEALGPKVLDLASRAGGGS